MTGKLVNLTKGSFNINASVDVASDVTLQGQGWGTKLVVVPATFTDNDAIISLSSITKAIVRDLLIDGEWDNGRALNDHGVYVESSTDCLVENVYVMQVRGQGFLTGGGGTTRCTFSKCWAYKAEHRGFNIGCTADHILVSDSYATDCTLSGFIVGSAGIGSTYIKFVNCIAYNPTVVNASSHFWAAEDCEYVEWTNCESHTSGDSGFALMTNYGQATNCLARDAVQHGFRIGGSRNTVMNFVAVANAQNGVSVEGDENKVIGGVADSNGIYGVRVLSAALNLVQGVTCKNNSQTTGGTRDGIEINGATSLYNIIMGNHCYDDQGTATQRYGINETNSANYNTITNNEVHDNITAQISTVGANTIVRDNQGYATENSGTATLLSGQTTFAVAHGLAATPTVINIAFREQGTNDYGRWWVDTIGAANFTLNVSSDPGASNLDFEWEVKVR